MSFTIFYNEKTPFQVIKTRSSKSRKIFGQKMAILSTFFFGNIGKENMSFTIFQNEKTPFQAIKTRSPKSPKIDIFFDTLLVQKWPFFQHFFLGNIGQENVFYYILERKNAFLGYKNKKFKKSKNCHFSKEVNLWFWSKNGHFFDFVFGSIGKENVFYDILAQKNAFVGYKKKSLKSRKSDILPNGLTGGFG